MSSGVIQSRKCYVCGDEASCLNKRLNTFTCSSCRFFFQRNIYRAEKLKCLKKDNCQIDFMTRKCCAKCRLNKCLSVGMRTKNNLYMKQNSFEDILSTKSSKIDNFLESKIRANFDMLDIDSQCLSKQNCLAISKPKRNYARTLNSYEREIIVQLQDAMNSFEIDINNPFNVQIQRTVGFNDFYLQKELICFQKMSSFKFIAHGDQLLLLSSFFVDILLLRLAENFNEPILLENLKHCISRDEILNNLKSIKLLNNEMNSDETIRDLIIVQFLFKERKNVTNLEYINYQQFVYRRLLRRYLEDYLKGQNETSKRFSSIMKLNSIVPNFSPLQNFEAIMKPTFVVQSEKSLCFKIRMLHNHT